MARVGRDDWVEDRFYKKGKKIEYVEQGQGQDIRKCHFPGDQNRAEDRYEEEAHNPNEEGQYVFQSLSPDF